MSFGISKFKPFCFGTQSTGGLLLALLIALSVVLTGCAEDDKKKRRTQTTSTSDSSSGGSVDDTAAGYSVSGTLSGLVGTLVLQNNGADDLTLTSNGTFAFASNLTDGDTYAVTISSGPANLVCTVTNGSGTIAGANVDSATVTCSSSSSSSTTNYSIGVTATGLTGTLVLRNNGGDDLTLTGSGSYTFSSALANGAGFNVTVLTQPGSQLCTISSGSGTLAGAAASVSVSCVNTRSIGGTIRGRTENFDLLQSNGSDVFTVNSNGNFNFNKRLIDSQSYTVSVQSQPGFGDCFVNNGSGTTAGADVTNVEIYCVSAGTIQGTELTLSTNVTTAAGTGSLGEVDATGTGASFDRTIELTTDGKYIYVCDDFNNKIRRFDPANNAVTTVAGANNNVGGADGPGGTATFDAPRGITSDGTNLYVVDEPRHTVRKIVIATYQVTTIAGLYNNPGSTDATGTAARFNGPRGITNDGANLYIAENGNHTIRKMVLASGVVTTIAGQVGNPGGTNGTGTAALFTNPRGITTDGTYLYIGDATNQVRKMNLSSGVVTTLAGADVAGAHADHASDGLQARFNNMRGLTTDGFNIYVADQNNQVIRKINLATTAVTTLAGGVGVASFADSSGGTGATARFNAPHALVTDGTSLFISDLNNYRLRKMD